MHLTVNLAMHKRGRVRGAFACLGAIAAGTAAAQHEVIEACRDLPTDAARIACLEAAIAGNGTGDPADGDAGPRDPADGPSPPMPEDDANAGAPPAADVPAEARKSDRPDDSAQADAAERPAPEAIGDRQVRARQRSDTDLESATGLQVAEYSLVPYRRLQVALENGQVWRQIAGDTQRIRADLRRNQTVDINESRLGGYQLRLNEMERTIRVERIR